MLQGAYVQAWVWVELDHPVLMADVQTISC